MSLLNTNGRFCSADVGHDGYKVPSSRDPSTATSPLRCLRNYIDTDDEHRCYIGDHRAF